MAHHQQTELIGACPSIIQETIPVQAPIVTSNGQTIMQTGHIHVQMPQIPQQQSAKATPTSGQIQAQTQPTQTATKDTVVAVANWAQNVNGAIRIQVSSGSTTSAGDDDASSGTSQASSMTGEGWQPVVALVEKQETSDEDRSVTPPHPLLMYLVLHSTLKYLDIENLKNCRLVCKAWDEVALNMILQNSEVRLYCARRTEDVKAGSKSIARFARFLRKYRISCYRHRFKVTNLTISHLGQEKKTWGSRPGFGRATYSVLDRLQSTVETLNLDNVLTSRSVDVMLQVIVLFPRLQCLKISFYHDYEEEINRTHLLPFIPPLAHLKALHIDHNSCRLNALLPLYWMTLWRLCPLISEVRLKDSYEGLALWMRTLIVSHLCKLSLTQLQITAVGWVLPIDQGREGFKDLLVESLSKVIRKFPLKQLTLDLGLSLEHWSRVIRGNLPESLHRLCIKSDFCMGSNYPENLNNQFMEGDSTDRILDILGPSVPETLHELVFHFKQAQGMDKTVSIHPGTLVFDGVRDLTWVCDREGSSSWESLCRNELQDVASIFPNIRRLETTIGTKRALRQLLTGFPNLEEVTISQYSRLQLSDVDVVSDQEVVSHNRRRKRVIKNLGFRTLKKLRSLTLESDCRKLTDLSIQDGFLKMPTLKALQIFQAPMFGPEAMQALTDLNLDRLSIQHK